jgi:hypothetical protein
MKTTFQLSILAVLGLSVGAQAAPTAGPMGPSAKMAAKLKKSPAPSWLAHYLPDDRYKIAGGVWKFVSTDLDTYVHLPNSPLMLRQSADSVIGFASMADAEEAGYTPEPGLAASAEIQLLPAARVATPLSNEEKAYLEEMGRAFKTMAGPGTDPRIAKEPLPRLLLNLEKALLKLKTAPVPPRFAAGGGKVRDGIDGLFTLINKGANVASVPEARKELVSSYVTFVQGVLMVGSVAGAENMRHYLPQRKLTGVSRR